MKVKYFNWLGHRWNEITVEDEWGKQGLVSVTRPVPTAELKINGMTITTQSARPEDLPSEGLRKLAKMLLDAHAEAKA